MRILFQLNKTNQQRQLEKLVWIFPIKLAMYATAIRNQGNAVIWDGINDGSFDRIVTTESQIDIPFLQLPHADRILTDAFNPKWQNNGNFKYRPGVYIQSTSHCVWGRCTFCSEQGKINEIREVDDVIREIKECKELGAVEIFDDSATFPTGRWLDEFCKSLLGINVTGSNGEGRIKFGCNLRINSGNWGDNSRINFSLMHSCGFRMVLFGVESANQKTLDKINKGVKVEDIIPTIKKANRAGLEPHIAVMFGYPWETDTEALNTLKLVHYLLRKGFAKTAQASFYTPTDGRVNEGHRRYVKRIYEVGYSPEFWFNKLKDIKNIDDIKYIWRGIKSAFNR